MQAIQLTPQQELISLFSDTHKDALGFRPSATCIQNFLALPEAEQTKKLDFLQAEVERQIAADDAEDYLRFI